MLGMEKLVGKIRGLAFENNPENLEYTQLNITANGDGLVVEALPPLASLVQLGESWQLLTAAFTGLAALPTTVAIARIWNGEPGNGKVYVIDSVAVFRPIIDVTTYDQFTVFAQDVRSPVVTAVPTDSGLAKTSLSGKQNYAGRARHDTGTANSAVTGRWDVIGTSPSKDGVIGGSAWACMDVDLRGRYIITPGGAFDIHVAEVTATANAFRAAIRWHEVQIPYVS